MDPEKEIIEIPFSIEYYRMVSGNIEAYEDTPQEDIDSEIEGIEFRIDSAIENNLEYQVTDNSSELTDDKEYLRGLSDGLEESINHDEVKRLMEAEDVLKKLKTSFKEYMQNAKANNDLFFNESNFENDLELITKYFDDE